MRERDRILLSIHNRHAMAILRGEKLFEFRRVLPKREPRWVSLYATSPVSMIVGEFEVARLLDGWPLEELWAETEPHAGITRAEFDKYFAREVGKYFAREVGSAIEVFEPKRFRRAIDPREADPDFHPPQSFCYWPRRSA